MIQKSMASESRPPLKRNILSFDLKSRISASVETLEQLRQRRSAKEMNSMLKEPLNTELDAFLNSLENHDFDLNHKVLQCKEILHNYKNNLPNSIRRTEQHDKNNQIVLQQVNDDEKLTIEKNSQQKSCNTSSSISTSTHDDFATTSSSLDSLALVQNESLRKQTNILLPCSDSCYDKVSIDNRMTKSSPSTESTSTSMSLTFSASDESSSENIFQSNSECIESENIVENDFNDCKQQELYLSHGQSIDDDENLSLDDNDDYFSNDDLSIDHNDSSEFKLILMLSTIEEESENDLDQNVEPYQTDISVSAPKLDTLHFRLSVDEVKRQNVTNDIPENVSESDSSKSDIVLSKNHRVTTKKGAAAMESIVDGSLEEDLKRVIRKLSLVFNKNGDNENLLDTVNKLVHEIVHNEAEEVGPTSKSCNAKNETRPENVSNQSLHLTLDNNQSSQNNAKNDGHNAHEYIGNPTLFEAWVLDENQSRNMTSLLSQDSNSTLSKSRPPKNPDLSQKDKKRSNVSNDQDLYIERCPVNKSVQHVLHQRSGETTSNIHDRPRSACCIDRMTLVSERPRTPCDNVRSTPVLTRPGSACGSSRKSRSVSKAETSHDMMHRRSFRSISPITERPSTACNTERRGPHSQGSRTPISERTESSSDTVYRRLSIRSISPISERPSTACNTERRGPHSQRSRTPIIERPESLPNSVQNLSNVHRSRTPTSQRPKLSSSPVRRGPNTPRSRTPASERPELSFNSVQSITRSRTPISERPDSSSDTMRKGPNVHRSRTPVIERPESSSNTGLNMHRSRTPRSQRPELSSNTVQNGPNVHRSRTPIIERPESACKTERRGRNVHRCRTPVNEMPESPSNTVRKGVNHHRSRTPVIERPESACKTERSGLYSQRSRTPTIEKPELACDTVQKASVIHKSKTTKTTMQKSPVHETIVSASCGRCRSKWNPQKYVSIGGCQSCYSLLSTEERKQYSENGFHHRVASTRGGCESVSCQIIPNKDKIIRLCKKCHHDSHRMK